jgi:hypothetical protein
VTDRTFARGAHTRRLAAAAAAIGAALAAAPAAGAANVNYGGNALFGGPCCPARPGYDLATGWGSPFASVIAVLLPGAN